MDPQPLRRSSTSIRVAVAALLSLGLAACDACGSSATDAPSASGERAEGSSAAFAVFGTEDAAATPTPDPTVDEDGPPAPPDDIRHDAAPTADDFALAYVEGDWVTFRGNDDRSGVRDVRSIRTPAIRWSKQVGIQGYRNTPIVTSDGVFVSSQGEQHRPDVEDALDGVYRLDPATGAEVWRYPTGTNASGLAYVDGSLLVGGYDGRVHRIDAATGRAVWVAETGCPVLVAPMVDGERVLLTRERSVAVLSLETGAIVSQPEDRCHANHRAQLARQGEDVWMGAHDAPLQLYRGGELVWQAPSPAAAQRLRYYAYTPPLLTRSIAVALYNQLRLVQPDGTDRFVRAVVAHWKDNGQVAWIIELDRPADQVADVEDGPTVFNHAMPLIVGSRMYLLPTNRGRIEAWDVTTGQRIEHAAFPDCRRRQFASPVSTLEMAYVPRHDGVLYGVSLSPLRVVWSIPMGLHGAMGARTTHEPIAGGCSNRPTDGTALFATPAIGADGTVYVGSGDGWLYAIADRDW